jgi:hypothetical protein
MSGLFDVKPKYAKYVTRPSRPASKNGEQCCYNVFSFRPGRPDYVPPGLRPGFSKNYGRPLHVGVFSCLAEVCQVRNQAVGLFLKSDGNFLGNELRMLIDPGEALLPQPHGTVDEMCLVPLSNDEGSGRRV